MSSLDMRRLALLNLLQTCVCYCKRTIAIIIRWRQTICKSFFYRIAYMHAMQ